MTITVEHKTSNSIDIPMPAYYKWGTSCIKILDEKNALRVKDYEFDYGISRENNMAASIAAYIQQGKRITEQEFLDVFHRVGEKVKRELIKAIETDGWKAQEQAELKENALAEVETTQS
jgi:hypothetical protein